MAIKVMIVDDSNFMRKAIASLLSTDRRIEVASLEGSGEEALKNLTTVKPDVITLDWELPGMNGLAALNKIMMVRPTPVVMFSAYTKKGADVTMQALKAGAIDFIQKPSGSISLDLGKVKEELIKKVVTAASARTSLLKKRPQLPTSAGIKKIRKISNPHKSILAIASSTGGVQALAKVVPMLPGNYPMPVIVVQHMPAIFTKSLAASLNENSALHVKEAEDGDLLNPGFVFVAPGGLHTLVKKTPEGVRVKLEKTPNTKLKPCADVTLHSLAEIYDGNVVGLIMTGMGYDGTEGAALIKSRGGLVLAQDEATSTIFGMPRSVIEKGLADVVLPVQKIAEYVMSII